MSASLLRCLCEGTTSEQLGFSGKSVQLLLGQTVWLPVGNLDLLMIHCRRRFTRVLCQQIQTGRLCVFWLHSVSCHILLYAFVEPASHTQKINASSPPHKDESAFQVDETAVRVGMSDTS